ncbi:hypothetical protein AAG570_009057 [Ranatra chinensis]|uniref:Uncharacterized protein n=1 Tax=Ranatra chinensis TaxID=642074 RepID=A0ABD0YTA9_9HEMI
MASKRRKMLHKNKKQETTEIENEGLFQKKMAKDLFLLGTAIVLICLVADSESGWKQIKATSETAAWSKAAINVKIRPDDEIIKRWSVDAAETRGQYNEPHFTKSPKPDLDPSIRGLKRRSPRDVLKMNSSSVCLLLLVVIGVSSALPFGNPRPMNPPPNLPQRHGRSIEYDDEPIRHARDLRGGHRMDTGTLQQVPPPRYSGPSDFNRGHHKW